MSSTKNLSFHWILSCIFLLLCMASAQAREVIPAPPTGGHARFSSPAGPGNSTGEKLDPHWISQRNEQLKQDFFKRMQGDKSEGVSNIGGYDKEFLSMDNLRQSDIAVASNGDIFVAVEYQSINYGLGIRIYRSNDGGESFYQWSIISTANPDEHISDPCLIIAEGSVSRVYVAYRKVSTTVLGNIFLGYDDLADSYGSMGPGIPIMEDASIDFSEPTLASDSMSYSQFFLYAGATGHDNGHNQIYYSRSLDRGESFEDFYIVGDMIASTRGYHQPQVSYGYGGYVHMAMTFYVTDSNGDDSATVRRCPNDGGGGVYGWEEFRHITPFSNGINETNIKMTANPYEPELVVAYSKYEWSSDDQNYVFTETATKYSGDSGVTWEDEVSVNVSLGWPRDLLYQPITDMFILCGQFGTQSGFVKMDSTEPTEWFSPQLFTDRTDYEGNIIFNGYAMDPSRSDKVCTSWGLQSSQSDTDTQYFDAEWRGGPGYPNLASGFPVALSHEPQSDPVIVDIDNDGDLEILFTDSGDNIRAYHHDGSSVQGWPISTGSDLGDAPIAVGDLNGNGQMSIVVGTADGEVFCFNGQGQYMPGFPVEYAANTQIYVSIGALGGVNPRTIICGGGNEIHFLNHLGEEPINSYSFNTGGQDMRFPAAVGDVDGDGVSEVVVALANKLLAIEMHSWDFEFVHFLSYNISGAPTMADLDLDGDIDIITPLVNGIIDVFDGGGDNYPGFPVQSNTYAPLSSVAVVQLTGSAHPELVVSSNYEQVEVYNYDGTPALGDFPLYTSPGWTLYSSPIIGNMDSEPGPDIIIGDEVNIRAWSNTGQNKTAWPRSLGDPIHLAGAIGDLDGNGYNEVVFLSTSNLYLVDVHAPVQRSGSWPMYGNNPQRTGCLDCVEDLLSAVEPGDELFTTRIKFAPPSPNPTNGPTLFSFDLPVRASVQLDVFDLRGHRVRSVVKEELSVGSHSVNWDGRDAEGKSLASGVYFANLKVRGPGLQQNMNRKLNLVR